MQQEKIHSDIARGIHKSRSDLLSNDLLENEGSMTKAKEKGRVRLEGKDYLMKDGDIVHFRFNV